MYTGINSDLSGLCTPDRDWNIPKENTPIGRGVFFGDSAFCFSLSDFFNQITCLLYTDPVNIFLPPSRRLMLNHLPVLNQNIWGADINSERFLIPHRPIVIGSFPYNSRIGNVEDWLCGMQIFALLHIFTLNSWPDFCCDESLRVWILQRLNYSPWP